MLELSRQAVARSLLPLTLTALLAACEGDRSPVGPARLNHEQGSDGPIGSYGLNVHNGPPGTVCSTAPYRQFDFWLGEWDVPGPPGLPAIPSSRISEALYGCAIIEHWQPRSAPHGRSINSYDAASGVWRQTWVPENTQNGRPLRLAGNLLPNGSMQMSGVRHHWFFGIAFIDSVTWTALDQDHVNQAFSLDIPAINFHLQGVVRYARSANFVENAPFGSPRCQPGGDAAENRMLDFTIGRWEVSAGDGRKLGKSEIVVDPTVSGCLIEEEFAGPHGYRALGWLYYDALVNRFYRTYVDSEGRRFELSGLPTVNPLVLEGPLPGTTQLIRMTWTTQGDGLLQTWALSTDGGATWNDVETYTFERH